MKRKLLYVSLLAALSTVGYGFEYPASGTAGTSQVGGGVEAFASTDDTLDKVKEKTKNNFNSLVEKTDLNFNKVQSVVNQEITDRTGADAALQGQITTNKNDITTLSGKVTTLETKDTDLQNQITINKNDIAANKTAIETNKTNIANNKTAINQEISDRIAADTVLQNQISNNTSRIEGLEKSVDNLGDKMNKGMSLMAAMSAVEFQDVSEGEMAIGAGIGHYGDSQSVAIGVAYSPTQNLNVNMKYSVTAGDVDSFAIGAGASYKFRVK